MDSYEAWVNSLIDILDVAKGLYGETVTVSSTIRTIYEYFKIVEMDRVPWKTSASWTMLNTERNRRIYPALVMMDLAIGYLMEEYPKWASSFIDKDVLEGRKPPRGDAEELAVSVLEYLKDIRKKMDEVWNRSEPQAFEKVSDNNEFLNALRDVWAISNDAVWDAILVFLIVEKLALISTPRPEIIFIEEKPK